VNHYHQNYLEVDLLEGYYLLLQNYFHFLPRLNHLFLLEYQHLLFHHLWMLLLKKLNYYHYYLLNHQQKLLRLHLLLLDNLAH
jgi:hypothetical protein